MIRKAHPQAKRAQAGLDTGGPIPPAVKIQGGKSKPLYNQIGQALSRIMPDRRVVEPFGGAAGVSLGMRAKEALLSDINPDLVSFHNRLIDDPWSLEFDPEEFTYSVGDDILMPDFKTDEVHDLGKVTQSMADPFKGDPFFMGPKFYELRDEFNELRRKDSQGVIAQSERKRKDQLFLVLQHMSMNGLLRYSPAEPSYENKWAGSLGFAGKEPINQPMESGFFEMMRERNQKLPIKEGKGNTFRPQRFAGGKGKWEMNPWSQAMQGWEYTHRPLRDLMTSDIALDDKADQFIVDPPYWGEQGAHTFFGKEGQDQTLALLEALKASKFPTTIYNSFSPDVVEPVRDLGFDIHELSRRDQNSGKASGRGMKPELMGQANIDQTAFMNAWNNIRQG